MANLPAANYISNAARTVAEVKQGLEDIVAFIRQMVGGDDEEDLVLASDAVTPTKGQISVDTQASAATDDLANIVTTNLPAGSWLLLRSFDAARNVVVKHNAGGSGQISLRDSVDVTLNATNKYLLLRRVGANWEEVARFGFQEAVFFATTTGGTADAATLTIGGMRPSAWFAGMVVVWNPPGANTVATPTINPSSIGAKTIVDRAGNALAVGALANGTFQIGIYDGTNVRAILLPSGASLATAQAWTAPQRPQATETANKTGSNAPDMAAYQDFNWTLTGNLTIANPTITAAMVGQRGVIRVAHAGFTLTSIGSTFKRIGTTGTPTLPTTSGVIARFDYHIVSTTRIEYRYSDAEA
jgi:hypothetical protein